MHNKREIEESKGSGDRYHGYHTGPRCSFILLTHGTLPPNTLDVQGRS